MINYTCDYYVFTTASMIYLSIHPSIALSIYMHYYSYMHIWHVLIYIYISMYTYIISPRQSTPDAGQITGTATWCRKDKPLGRSGRKTWARSPSWNHEQWRFTPLQQVCIIIDKYIYIYIYIYVYIYIYRELHMHIHVHTCIYIYAYTYGLTMEWKGSKLLLYLVLQLHLWQIVILFLRSRKEQRHSLFGRERKAEAFSFFENKEPTASFVRGW